MVELMDISNLSEGLFLKNYLGTVTATSRPRTVTHVEKKPTYAYGKYSHQKYNNLLKNGMLNHAGIIYELEIKNESEIESGKYQQNDVMASNVNIHMELENVIQVKIDDEKDKKKEKKWTFGGFFRRRNKKDADDSSEESDEDNKRGFLSRRKSKRDRRKLKSRKSTNGFDVVIPQHKEDAKNREISVEHLWSNDLKPGEPNGGPLRYINRHPDLCKINNVLQIPKHCRRDSNFSRSTGGSENNEGKKNRKEAMARVEAKRDMLQDDSSSDEFNTYRSSSLNRLNDDYRKPRRTDKHKRLSKDEDPQSDLRVIKSDFEGGRRVPSNCRWISKTYCPDWNDHEASKSNLMNHSGTPSPCRSPRARQRHLLQYMLMPNSYPTSTFPPGIHSQHWKNESLSLSPTRNNFAKENQSLFNDRNQAYMASRDFECSFPTSLSISGSSDQKKLTDYEQFKNSYGSARKKSLSYDQNIHKTSCFENKFEVNKTYQQADFKTRNRFEMLMNDGKKADIYDHNPQMAVRTYGGVAENRTDSMPSLQFGIFPQKPTQIVRKLSNGNSFCENARNCNPDRSNSYQDISSVHGYCSQESTPQLKASKNNIYWNISPSFESMSQKSHLDGTPSILRYYADQNPRSRNPIHITCNPTISEQPYLSDSQMIVKTVQSTKNPTSNFWKIKEKELLKQKKREDFLKTPFLQSNSGLNRSRLNSKKLKAETKAPPKSSENAINEFKKNLVDGNQFKGTSQEDDQDSATKISKNPPEPPVRKLSKQEVLARLQKCEQLRKQENEINKDSQNEKKIHSYNLDEALNELEVIYNSLSLKDEDLVDRAERRDFPIFRPNSPAISVSVRNKIQNFFAKEDYSKTSELTIPVEHQRALPLRRSCIPDKTTDDMAFRRLNPRDRTDVKKLPSQSYLRSSPALLPVQNVSSNFRKESPVLEPDITYDDVVFRNIRHANSTLKIQDPQPPFGIPVGIITPASNSDYLHAMPAKRFRPTFTSTKIPDVVKDDLAFRNLRKDNKTNTCLESNKNELKKRAVRSLSANLYSIMQKGSPNFISMEANNVDVLVKNREKTQSLTDLTEEKYVLEKKLKTLKEEKNAKGTEFFELPQDARKKTTVSWTDLASLNENCHNVPIKKFQKIGFPICPEDNWKKLKLPVVELSKFPAAIPSSSLQGNPFNEPSFVDDDQLENLLSTLAKEAENASKDLEKQLNWLEMKKTADIDKKSNAVEEFNKTFRSVNKIKRKRNLSFSNTNEFNEEIRKTSSLERRKKSNKKEFSYSETLDRKTNEVNFIEGADKNEVTKFGLERNLSKSGSVSCLGYRERERRQSFEVVTDLFEILKDEEAEQYLSNEIIQKGTNKVFQEVYEYNCKLSFPDDRAIRGGVENIETAKEKSRIPNVISDVETEFEKLHEEVNSTKETKETDFTLVDDLMADITSADQSPGDLYSSFPFPNHSDTPSNSEMLKHRDGICFRSDKGEEFPPPSDDSYTDFDGTTEIFREKAEVQIKMFQKDKEPGSAPTSNSSSENDRKCEKIEKHKGGQRHELCSLDPTPKSFKTTRKKEELKRGGLCGPFLKSYLNSQCSDNQVPSSDYRRFSSRRDDNKTDSASGCSEEHSGNVVSGVASPRETVIVRETKASRLRAASRTSTSKVRSPSVKIFKDVKKNEKDFQNNSISGSLNCDSVNKKDIDKSYTRKSHLNRSHTSEGVYDDVYISGGSYTRRRRSRNLSLESSLAKSITDKDIFSSSTMGNVNGIIRDSQTSLDQLPRTNLIAKSPFHTCRKSTKLMEKCSLKPSLDKKLTDDAVSVELQAIRSQDRFDKSKQIDIKTRAEILAASTLKMINRLDEINKKSRKALTNSCIDCISGCTTKKSEDSDIFKTDSKKAFSPDDITSEISLNRICLKAKKPKSPNKSPDKNKSEIKPSILKNKPSGASSLSCETQKPVSILKRKSFSQDDSQSCSPPVTFSPSVLKKETDVKKQSILKKRRSLDENEVMRRRSYSPDASYDFKSILKTQRRLSMEELTRRSHSPDSTPQGILKRKSSKEEEMEDEPQGILKRKSLACLNSHHHMQIFDNVSTRVMDTSGNVRPILKKKSSSEEHSASDPSLAEGPKSILKKKGSLEIDEQEEKPMKPILKSSRIPSIEEPEDGKRNKSLIFSALDEPKPILKRENSRGTEAENGVILRNIVNRRERPYSSSDIDNELNAIFLKRQSLELQPIGVINFHRELQRTQSASSNEKLKGDLLKRPFSVAEKVNKFENFLKVEKVAREKRNLLPGTSPSNFVGSQKIDNQRAVSSLSSGALPKTRSADALAEMTSEISPELNEEGESQVKNAPLVVRISSHVLCLKSLDSNDINLTSHSDIKFRTNSENLKFKEPSSGSRQDARTDQLLFRKISSHSKDSEDVFLSNLVGQCDEKYDFTVNSCGEISNKNGGVAAGASLCKESLKNCKGEAKMKSTAKESSESTGINPYGEKKSVESNTLGYHSQPVSTKGDLAVCKNKTNDEIKRGDQDGSHEDEMCTMSYEDRLRLFESIFTPKFPETIIRKRGVRYRTQPVTTDEVEKAKSQKSSFSAYEIHSARHTVTDSSGLISFKENICDLPSNHNKSKPAGDKMKSKGILKNFCPRNEFKISNSDSNSSDSEKKGILKSELSENNHILKKNLRKVNKEATSELKGILKQPSLEKKVSSSSEEESMKDECKTSHRLKIPGSNLAAVLQRVELIGGDVGKISQGKKLRVLPECMQNAGIARVVNKPKNNSLIVKSRSQSSVSSAFQSLSECVECSLMSKEETEMNQKNDETATNFDVKDGTENPSLRSVELRRSATQPLRSSDGGTDDDLSGASIQERLARLKKSGELDWQKRKSHVTNLEDELSVISAGNYLFNEHYLLRGQNPDPTFLTGKENEELENSSSILADRLGKLDAAKQGWKKRIKPSDAVCFSVEGKMLKKKVSLSPPNQSEVDLQISPTRPSLLERKKKSPKAIGFKSKKWNPSLNSVPSSPSERINNTIARCGNGKNGFFGLSICSDLKEVNAPVVLVPKNDDETFTSFFDGLNAKKIFQEHLEIKDEDLDAVTNMKSSQLLVQKRNIKTQKRRTTVKNPVKALAARINLQEYTEIKIDTAELKRMRVEKVAKTSNLSIEALAGLASQEDFTTVSLKKAVESGINPPDAPYKNLMLLQVKGRRHVQTRLIEPVAHNVNTGDCFILVTPNRIFHYVGEFANVIEKSRGAEISLHIQQKGDLGCTASSVITVGMEGRASADQIKEFWKLLNGEPGRERKAGNLDEDELFESALIDTNMVYEVMNDELVPVEVYWGSMPKIEVLDPNKVLVFDFGSEFYVWNGKNVSVTKRKMALRLAKELWEEGFDYSDCDLCPLTAASFLGDQISWCEIPDSEKKGPIRPDWSLFAKVTQNMETVLFREKFLDWPDYTRVIRGRKGDNREKIFSSSMLDVKPCDAENMLVNVLPEPDLVLEGNHLGRGMKYFNEETRKCSEVTTHNVTVWHVNEYEYSEVPNVSVGQFHMGDSYVVRWHYVITTTGRELSGQPSKHLTTGRNRYAYFFWQGQNSPINDKGASACLTVELDKERGPQVRVVQGREPPAFINLFKGRMVVHMKKRFSEAPCEKLRLFICRGAVESESALFEVPCSMRQLRSLASFVLVNKDTGKVIVWYGWKCPENNRKIAFNAAKRLQLQTPEFEFTAKEINITEETEGNESQDFIRALGGDNRQLYFSLIQDKTELRTPRLFHLTGVSGEFLFNEVMSLLLIENSATPLPFLQSDLYSASQPALFLLDSISGLWLWQGWWEKNPENERGSGWIRFQAERRAAMATAIAYWNLKYGASTPKAYLIWAGLEPLEFTNQFPFWTDRDDVSEINMKDGRKPGEVIPVKRELASLTQSTYPLAQLLNRPLPDGVNPISLEDYLEPQCFRELFAMEKEEFLNLPSWKKKKLKQDAGLF